MENNEYKQLVNRLDTTILLHDKIFDLSNKEQLIKMAAFGVAYDDPAEAGIMLCNYLKRVVSCAEILVIAQQEATLCKHERVETETIGCCGKNQTAGVCLDCGETLGVG